MIFPKDISKRVSNSGSASSTDKRKFTIFIVAIANFILYFLLSRFMKNYLGLDSKWAFRVQIILFIIINIILFRLFIFDESSHEEELDASNKASFSRYYRVRKELTSDLKSDVNLFEYLDGNVFCVACIRYGSNSPKKSKFTYNLYRNFISEVYSNKYKISTFSMTEDFEDTDEYKSYISTINSIEDKDLRAQSLLMAEEVLNFSKENSKVLMTYILVATSSPSQKYYFGDNIKSIVSMLNNKESCIREVKFLDNSQYENLVRVDHGLEVMDMSMIKSVPSSDKDLMEFKSLVKVFNIEYSSNKENMIDKSIIENKTKTNSKKVGV